MAKFLNKNPPKTIMKAFVTAAPNKNADVKGKSHIYMKQHFFFDLSVL